jgi:iron complex outermembrane recepter protein
VGVAVVRLSSIVHLKRTLLASALMSISAGAFAQEATVLETLTVEDEAVSADQATGGPKGETIIRQVSVGKSDRPIAETPRSVSVVSEQRLSDQGVDDVSDALLYVPGVYAETFGPDTRVDSKTIRGISAPQFLDGLRNDFSFYNNSRIDPYALSAVEVIKGPVGALYGSGALGGIVNLTSKLPQEVPAREVFVEVGTHDRARIGVDLTGPVTADGNLLYRFVGAGQKSGTQVDFVDDDGLFINPSITWQPTDDTKLTVIGLYQNDDGGLTSRFVPIEGSLLPTDNGNFVDKGTFLGEPDFDRYAAERASITGLFEHRFNETFSMDVAARYTDSNAKYDQVYPFPWNVTGDTVPRLLYSARNEAQSFVSDTRLNADFDTGAINHAISFGLDYQNSTTRSDGYSQAFSPIDMINPVYGTPIPSFTRARGPEQQTDQTGIYAFDNLSFDDRLFVTLGLRHDWYNDAADVETRAFSGNAGVLYRFDNGIAPYVSYATAFEPQPADSRGFTYDPVTGRQIEAGIKYQPVGTPHLFTASVFEIDQTDRRLPNPVGSPTGPEFVQNGETTIRGFELEAQTRYRDIELLAGYSYLDTEDKVTGFELASVPTHQASAWVTYRPQGNQLEGWFFGGGLRYVGSSLDGADNLKTPSFVLADALVGYETERWSAQLNVQNITDEDYLTTCLARGDCFYGQGRTVNFKLATRF